MNTNLIKPDLLKKDNSVNNYIESLKLEGVGVYNKKENLKFKRNWNLIKKSANNGKTTLIKSVYYTLFNDNQKYLESYLPHDDFYINLKFKYSNQVLDILRKKEKNNLDKEINLKILDDINKKETSSYFNLLKKIKKTLLINEDSVEDLKLDLYKDDFEEYKNLNKNIKIEKIYTEFSRVTGYNLDEDIREEIKNTKEEWKIKLEELEKDFETIEEKLELEKLLNSNSIELNKELSDLKKKIFTKDLDKIYKEINKLLDYYYKYKKINERKDIGGLKEEKLKHKFLELKEKLKESLYLTKEKIENFDNLLKQLKNNLITLIKNNNFVFEEKEYKKFSKLLEEIYLLKMKLLDFNEETEIEKDIKLLLELKETNLSQFNFMLNSFKELENIYELEEYEKLDNFLDKLLSNNSLLFINLIKKYSSNVVLFSNLLEELNRVEKLQNLLSLSTYNFLINLFGVDKNMDIYNIIISLSDINNSITYENLYDINSQILKIIKEKSVSLFDLSEKEILNLKSEIIIELEQNLKNYEKEIKDLVENLNEENVEENFEDKEPGLSSKEELEKLLNFNFKNTDLLRENTLKIKIYSYDELEMTFFEVISKLIKDKKEIEKYIEEYILKEKEYITNSKKLEETTEVIEYLFNKYSSIKSSFDEKETYNKENLPLKIKELIKELQKNYDLNVDKLTKIINYQTELKEKLEEINIYYNNDYKLYNNTSSAYEYINNVVNDYVDNIRFFNKEEEIWVEYYNEDNKLVIPLKISNYYYKVLFKILNVILLNEQFRNENKNLILFLDNIDKQLTELEQEEIQKFLEFIANKNNLQIILTSR